MASNADCALIDFASGRLLRAVGNVEARAHPGSVIKPFALLAALEAGLNPSRTVSCQRVVAAGGRRLPCAHSDAIRVFAAVDALAWSCNSYFAALARYLNAHSFRQLLLRHGLPALMATSRDELTLQVLGEAGIEASVLDLAQAYRRLMQSPPDVIRDGLSAAVDRGTASSAGPRFAGKTGTSAGNRSVQGWFAGVYPRAKPRWAIATHVTTGRGGADAAPAARSMIEGWQTGR